MVCYTVNGQVQGQRVNSTDGGSS